MSSIAVVILNYNGRPFLEKFLPSVISCTPSARIVVVDNCSNDDSIEFLKTQKVELIELDQNYGYAGGYKKALEMLEDDFFVLLNSDVEVTDGWLNPLHDLMEKNPDIGAVQPKIKSFDNRTKFEYAGAGGGLIDWLGYPFCRGRIFLELEEDKGQYDDTTEVFWASGACMMVRRSALIESGNLDPDFFAHMEEIDLCWRMKNLGYRIFYCGDSTVFHVGGGTLPASNPRKTYLNFRNGIFLILKNKKLYQLIYTLPIRWCLDWVAAIKFLLFDNPKDGWAVIRSHFSVIRYFLKMLSKRSHRKRMSHHTGIYWRSIIWARYVRGIKTFTELNQRL